MSRGPGKVQRAILTLFEAQPKAIFSTAEICEAIYGRSADKRHRVAVLRALRTLEGTELRHGRRVMRFVPGRIHERADDLWFNFGIWQPRYGQVLRTRPAQAGRRETDLNGTKIG